MFKQFEETLTFDDVLLVPQYSDIRPKGVDLTTRLTKGIRLKIPLISAAMDTVTESKMAIALATHGGIGIIHKNLSIENQVEEVKKVKRWENGFIEDPVVLSPEDTIEDVVKIRKSKGFRNIPIVNNKEKLVGLISELDYYAPDDLKIPIKFKMRLLKEIAVAKQGITLFKANKIIREKKLSVLCIVNKAGKLRSIVTRSDLLKNEEFPLATKDEKKRLRVGAAVSVGEEARNRAHSLAGAGVDVIVVDVAHGHSKGVAQTIRNLKKDKELKSLDIIGGNIATEEAAKALVKAGADAIKVGVGPGSICTTRVIAGIGIPQLSAIRAVVKGRGTKKDIPIIADGGMKSSGDLVKALAAGAESLMSGSLFAGCEEAPGEIEFRGGRMYKTFRGMGSYEAMVLGSKDRYAQGEIEDTKKLIPEGVSAQVLYKGHVADHIVQLAGGIRSGLAYQGTKDIKDLQKKAKFIKVTEKGTKESHPHSLDKIKEVPNYKE